MQGNYFLRLQQSYSKKIIFSVYIYIYSLPDFSLCLTVYKYVEFFWFKKAKNKKMQFRPFFEELLNLPLWTIILMYKISNTNIYPNLSVNHSLSTSFLIRTLHLHFMYIYIV